MVFVALALLATPAAAAEEAPICTDRPTKANAVCTVTAGKFQMETSLAQWSRIETGGSVTEVWQVGGSVLKFGLSERSDLQLGFTPFVDVDSGPSRLSGIGDLTARYKHRLTADGALIQIAFIPFVKLPTAKHGIGNGKVEGGLAFPISIATDSPVTLTFGPELDVLADTNGDSRHLQLVNLINASAPVAPRLTLTGELWMATNFDPAERVTLASADLALTYAANANAQVDLGANLGLNSVTLDLEIYAGISLRF